MTLAEPPPVEGGLGAEPLPDGGCRFLVWAPRAEKVELHIHAPEEALLPMLPAGRGYHAFAASGVGPGATYSYRLDGGPDRPDPASRFQPDGVHGPSQVVAAIRPDRSTGWVGIDLDRHVFCEVHVGTASLEGTFDGLIGRLDSWRNLGITAVELMPVAQFPGERNWGYDGVQPFAAQNSYGGPEGLRRLVDACHSRGLTVVLDVVYNHLGPEGNYLAEFGPYFTSAYRTPWGPAVNFDGPESGEVRRYFIENALYWLGEIGVDALRLDALHAIIDRSARTFLEELSDAVGRLRDATGRRIHLIAENDTNDRRLVLPRSQNGVGLDSQWSDDFHHSLHVLLTGERDGYYADFGGVETLARAWTRGFAYDGRPSAYRRRLQGSRSDDLAGEAFVVCAQNHDQIGNRMLGERIATLVSFEAQKLALGAVSLSPFLPLFFMGEEHGETAPFLYFTSHGDPGLAEAVRAGRREEFRAFRDRGEAPDPQAGETFERSRPDWQRAEADAGRLLADFLRECLLLRREWAPRRRGGRSREMLLVSEDPALLVCHLGDADEKALLFFSFDAAVRSLGFAPPPGRWRRRLDSAAKQWNGPGSILPQTITGGRTVSIRLQPWSISLFEEVSR